MRYEIVLAPDAVTAFKQLSARERATLRDSLERHLRYEPDRVSKARIKRLRGLIRPQYRLRVDDLRVFYDVQESEVHLLAIVTKSKADGWLAEAGQPAQEGGAGEGKG